MAKIDANYVGTNNYALLNNKKVKSNTDYNRNKKSISVIVDRKAELSDMNANYVRSRIEQELIKEGYDVVTRRSEELRQLFKELEFSQTGVTKNNIKLGELTEANYILYVDKDSYLRILEVESGELLANTRYWHNLSYTTDKLINQKDGKNFFWSRFSFNIGVDIFKHNFTYGLAKDATSYFASKSDNELDGLLPEYHRYKYHTIGLGAKDKIAGEKEETPSQYMFSGKVFYNVTDHFAGGVGFTLPFKHTFEFSENQRPDLYAVTDRLTYPVIPIDRKVEQNFSLIFYPSVSARANITRGFSVEAGVFPYKYDESISIEHSSDSAEVMQVFNERYSKSIDQPLSFGLDVGLSLGLLVGEYKVSGTVNVKKFSLDKESVTMFSWGGNVQF